MEILQKAVQRLRKRSPAKCLILMYHRVTDGPQDPWSLCVSPKYFAEQLQVITKSFEQLSLQEMIQQLRNKNHNQRWIVLTFDDGYADNLYYAKPLLERYDVPSTFFISTGNVDKDREFWWDELERLLLQPSKLPDYLSLNIKGHNYQWKLGESSIYSEHDHHQFCSWKIWQKPPTNRHLLYIKLWQLLKPLYAEDREKMINALQKWARVEPEGRITHRSLSSEELIKLKKGEIFDIGAHTATHPTLSSLPVHIQKQEIQQSKHFLEEVLNRTVNSFAYPYGAKADYTYQTITIAKESAFNCACSLFEGSVGPSTDYYELPRFQVFNWNGEEFSEKLYNWFNDY
jgi:peptidoglycan/xylan/chitin deacetylase (PgdA/CDA1 family)